MAGFEGKTVLVTGAGAGIGRATALAFARAGARVAVADREHVSAEEVVGAIQDAGGSAISVRVDVRNEDEVKAMMDRLLGTWGDLDAAVNNAGIGGTVAPMAEYPESEWHRVIAVNLTGVWHCMQHQIRVFKKRGKGSIVNVASMGGLKGFPQCAAYAASKHGVIGLTRTAALEYARSGIRVNAVCPGFTDTAMVAKLQDQTVYSDRLERMVPMGRLGKTSEIAGVILFLCSEESAFMTGHALAVDGGMGAQ